MPPNIKSVAVFTFMGITRASTFELPALPAYCAKNTYFYKMHFFILIQLTMYWRM